MELYEIGNTFSERLAQKANRLRIPLGGTIELTPLCNMHCKMCYVYKSYEEMCSVGSMLSCEQWIKILQDIKDNGVLYLLITGGEPLLHPHFKQIYKAMLSMGFLVTINTNGTLINEDWADFFAENRCKRFNITLYGMDDKTYEEVCGNPRGFSAVMNSAALLKERKIPFIFTSSLISENADQLEDLYRISKEMAVSYRPATYMFPAIRRNLCAEQQQRMSPEMAARVMLQYYAISKSEKEMKEYVHSTFANLFLPPRLKVAADQKGYPCRAGKSGFWITWQGNMTSCAMLERPYKNLVENSFSDCWKYIVEQTKNVPYCSECIECNKQNICHVCPAAVYSETQSFEKRPLYVCRYTDELIYCLLQYLSSEERIPYEKALKEGGFNQII